MHPLKTWDRVILYIGSDSYDETIKEVSRAGVITVGGHRFKEIKGNYAVHWTYYFRGIWIDKYYTIKDNRDGKLKASLDPSF